MHGAPVRRFYAAPAGPNADRHEGEEACHLYGAHAVRRGPATLSTGRMPALPLQKNRHRSFSAAVRYIQPTDKTRRATDAVYVRAS